MAKFSLYLAGHTLQALDRNKECAFKDSLRGLFRQAGLEGKQIGVILEVHVPLPPPPLPTLPSRDFLDTEPFLLTSHDIT